MANKHTKKALFLSMLSILLCLSMLVGSTFAWFTDTASTGVNTIVAGNLDVGLNYWDGEWKDAEASDAKVLFGTDDLWEPGFTKVAYYQVVNNGSLVLKFRVGTKLGDRVIGKTQDDKEIDLTKYIKFAVVEAEQGTLDDRLAARTAADAAAVNAFDAYSSELELPVGEDKVFAVIAYMPEGTNNDANHGTGKTAPSIEFGIKVDATQKDAESDSFGSDYDASAMLPENIPGTVVVNQAMQLKGRRMMVSIPANAGLQTDAGQIADQTQLELSVEPAKPNENITLKEGEKAEAYASSLVAKTADGDQEITSAEPMTVTLEIGAGHTGVIAVYNGTERITGVAYNSAAGTISFDTKDFGTFTVVDKKAVSGGGGNADKGGTDDEKDMRATLDLGGVVDFGGAVINSDNSDGNWGANLREYTFKDGVVVKNLTIKGTNSAARWWHADGDVTFENCRFEPNGTYAVHFDSGKGTITFKNCTFMGWSTFAAAYSKINFEGCTFKKGSSSYNAVATRCDTSFKDCVFENNAGILTQKPDTRFDWSIDNCTFDGVLMTADNIDTFPYTSYAGVDSDIWTKHDLTVNGVPVS